MTAKIIVFDQMCLTRRAGNMNQPTENRLTFNGPTCYLRLADTSVLQIDQHSSSSCEGTSGLLHIMGSNTIILLF